MVSKPGDEMKRTSSKSKSQSHKLTDILSGNKALCSDSQSYSLTEAGRVPQAGTDTEPVQQTQQYQQVQQTQQYQPAQQVAQVAPVTQVAQVQPVQTVEVIPQPAVAEPTVLRQWTDEAGYTWRAMDDGNTYWWTGTEWQKYS